MNFVPCWSKILVSCGGLYQLSAGVPLCHGTGKHQHITLQWVP